MIENKLNVLRNEIDKIDKNLIELLSRRLSLVSQIGKIKSRFGLFIYSPEREEQLMSCRKKEAIKLGISPDLVEDVLRRIMRESYYKESKKGFKRLYSDCRPVVIIGGKGRMGQFFAKMLTLSGYQVKILDQDDWINAKSILINVGVVFISVPIHLMTKVVNTLPPLPDDCVIIDLSSIKTISLKTILNIHSGPVLGLHPMFSPDNENMIKQAIICCEGRYPESYQWVLKQLQLWGAKLYYCTSMEHDKYMSFIQSLCHLITFADGYHLFKENVDLDKMISFSSPIFKLKLITIGRLFHQDPQLYANIIMESHDNLILIKRYYKRLGTMLMWLERNDKIEFIVRFNKIKNWLGVHADAFFKDSCKLLQLITDMKK
ncbi:T-protein (includes chorismate mutase and prephenate dehydrogenase) [Candidatus Blochmanniella vafra str. BVAF]|uniref:T-protein n=1 Tax=Blochmanniella vafra (strain BVAF) TaxID=859654 RepID=E8Q5T7_BLOVB|nr:T-protein (includes chorismate mutase and prephenate dehydrogenase) [Candidatus Blochmannia vafer str. BVAF]